MNPEAGFAAHLAESRTLPTFVVGRDGVLRHVGPAIAEWLDGGVGQPLGRWIHAPEATLRALLETSTAWHGRAALLQGEGPPIEVSLEAYPHPEGVVVLVLPEVKPLLAMQAEIGAINSQLTNLHRERVKQAAQLERTAGELASANRRLEQLDKLKSKFYANMNHELRTPLNSIIGFAEDALDGLAGPISEQLAQYFTTIYRSGTRQLALITDVLDLAKLQAGKATLELEPVRVADVVDEVGDVLRPLLARKQQRFVTDIPPDATLLADHQKAYQVGLNLISNAHKYGSQGGTITVSAQRDGRWWVLSVHDDGPGVPPEELPRLFEEFHQVEAKRSPRQQGTGLGLAITRQLVELHGGTIHAESEPGCGATFVFTLPAAEAGAP